MSRFDFIQNGKHDFYRLTENDVFAAEQRLGFRFPNELRDLYVNVGSGFIKGGSINTFDRLIDPGSVADMTLREDVFEFDPDLDIYDDENQLIFYEVNEGLYLTVDRSGINQSPVYNFDRKIADSLVEFLQKMDVDTTYYMEDDEKETD